MENRLNFTARCIISLLLIMGFSACSDDSDNLVKTADEWYVETDPYGSSYTFPNDELINKNMVSVQFKIAESNANANIYPYVLIGCNPGFTLDGYSSLTVEYKSEMQMLVGLPQTEIRDNGDEITVNYRYSLPASEEWNRQRVYFSHFNQPQWATLQQLMVQLNTKNVDTIHFMPDMEFGHDGSAEMSIRHLELHED